MRDKLDKTFLMHMTPQQHAALLIVSKRSGKSIGEFIREAIDEKLGRTNDIHGFRAVWRGTNRQGEPSNADDATESRKLEGS